MTRAVRTVVVLLLVLTALGIPLGALAQETQQNAPQRYIVAFNSNVPSAGGLAAQMANSDGFRVTHSFDNVFKGFSAELSPAQVTWLRAFSSVTSIEPDSVAHVTDQTTPTGIQRIGDLLNGTANIGGHTAVNIAVATLDTGVDISNPDLNVAGGFNAINASTCAGSASNGSYQDDNGHGTHVAGTIAAKDDGSGVVGVAPGAKVYAVKVFDSGGNGYVSSIICGINWIVSNASADNIKVVNFSGAWGGSTSPNCGNPTTTIVHVSRWITKTITTAADTAHQAVCSLVNTAGIPFVVAAGNDGKDASNTLPAAYPETIAVGALADSDGLPGGTGPATSWGPDDTRATFSNYGPVVTLYAPGVDILSDWPGGGLVKLSGTSMATPHVTGAVALYMVNHPGSSPATVKNALVVNGEAGTWGNPYGSQPLLNVGNAAFGPVAPPTPTHDVEVTSITAPSPVVNGVQTTVTVHIQNNGNQSESGLNVKLTNTTTSTDLGTNPATSPLGAGSGADVTFSWTPTQNGSNAFSAVVTNSNNNNTGTGNITVEAASHNISVTNVGAVTTPVHTNVANSVTAHVTNNGNVTESISVKLEDSLASNITSSPQSISLDPGASQDVTFGWTPSTDGTHNFTVTATANATPYVGTGSALSSTQVHDVHVLSVSVPGSVTQGQSATVSVSVKNDGDFSETFDLALSSTPSGAVGLPVSQSVTLTSGQTKTVNFTWNTTTSTVATNYTVTATATLGNAETDATPVNNSATSGTITVQPQPASQNIWVTGLTASKTGIRNRLPERSPSEATADPIAGATVFVAYKRVPS